MREIPILLYHNIGNYPENMMEDGMLPETFAKQMKFLADNGYQIVTLSQALDHMSRKTKLSSKAMAITIDGGYQDAFTNVFPALKKYDFPATFFVPPESIGKERTIGGESIKCMSWEEVHEIRNSGMDIGLLAYHGRSIRLENYNEHAIKESIAPAMQILRREINPQVRYCAFKEGVPEKSLWHFLKQQSIPDTIEMKRLRSVNHLFFTAIWFPHIETFAIFVNTLYININSMNKSQYNLYESYLLSKWSRALTRTY
jgi:hypothetical protein